MAKFPNGIYIWISQTTFCSVENFSELGFDCEIAFNWETREFLPWTRLVSTLLFACAERYIPLRCRPLWKIFSSNPIWRKATSHCFLSKHFLFKIEKGIKDTLVVLWWGRRRKCVCWLGTCSSGPSTRGNFTTHVKRIKQERNNSCVSLSYLALLIRYYSIKLRSTLISPWNKQLIDRLFSINGWRLENNVLVA